MLSVSQHLLPHSQLTIVLLFLRKWEQITENALHSQPHALALHPWAWTLPTGH